MTTILVPYCRLFIHLIILVIFILGVTQYQTFAQGPGDNPIWSTPYTGQNTLGKFLETRYTTLLGPCSLEGGQLKGKIVRSLWPDREVELSAVPLVLQRNLPTSSPVWSQTNESLARVLGYAFPSQSLVGFRFEPNSLVFDTNLTRDPATMLPGGTSSVIYAHNCSGIVSAAASAQGGVSLPVASIRGALTAEYTARSRNNIALVAGQFQSPYSRLLRSNSVEDPERLAALLTLWRWYVNAESVTPGAAARAYFIISSLRGVAMYEFNETTRDSNNGFQLSGESSGLPFVSLDARLQAALTQNISSRLQTYSTAVYLNNNQPEITWQQLLTPDQVINAVSETPVSLAPGYDSILQSGQTFKHTQRIVGLPQSLCNLGLWKIESNQNPSPGQTSISEAQYDERERTCAITVNYTPASTLFQNPAQNPQVELNYFLRYRYPVGTRNLQFQASRVLYATSEYPLLSARDQQRNRNWTSADSNNGIRWEMTIDVRDTPQGTLDWSQGARPEDMKITCAGKEIPVDVEVIDVNQPQSRVRIEVRSMPENIQNLSFNATTAQTCLLSGQLIFRRRAGGPVGALDIRRSLTQYGRQGLDIRFPSAIPPTQNVPNTPANLGTPAQPNTPPVVAPSPTRPANPSEPGAKTSMFYTALRWFREIRG